MYDMRSLAASDITSCDMTWLPNKQVLQDQQTFVDICNLLDRPTPSYSWIGAAFYRLTRC